MTEITPADNRRATALVCHFGRQNTAGLNAVFLETTEADRPVELIQAVLALHAGVIPILFTPDGLACASQMIHSLTTDDDADTRRAAKLITAHDQRDDDAFDATLLQAAEAGRCTQLLISVLNTFRTVVPVLYSEIGLQTLERSIITWAAREDAS